MGHVFSVHLIEEADIAGVLSVYEPYIANTAISFEYQVPSLVKFKQRVNSIITDYPWLVCMCNEKVIGYAYAGKHKERMAYQWSVDSAVYLSDDFHGKGIARILYNTLFAILRFQGIVNVYAGITLPNVKSEALHKAMRFYKIGEYNNVGYKAGKWHSVGWYQLDLSEHRLNPPLPKPIAEIRNDAAFLAIMERANASLQNIILK